MCNERLEFLGDSVVSLVFSEALFSRYQTDDEGCLTTRRAAIVSRPGLARLANRVDLGPYLQLGQGAERAGERRRPSVLASALEAVAGAVYLDLGLDAARTWLLSLAEDELDAERSIGALKSAKSRLQELSYANTGRPPTYRIISAEGPDHAKQYRVEVLLGDVVIATGEGSSRRAAETEAAAAALVSLETADVFPESVDAERTPLVLTDPPGIEARGADQWRGAASGPPFER